MKNSLEAYSGLEIFTAVRPLIADGAIVLSEAGVTSLWGDDHISKLPVLTGSACVFEGIEKAFWLVRSCLM